MTIEPNHTPRIFSYVVASDRGLAPNVTGGLCTLGVCKPEVRKHAQPGDWVVGMSTADDGRNKMIYAMQVKEKISYADYFHDPRFEGKKPIHEPMGDNFFEWNAGKGEYEMVYRSAAHFNRPQAIARDLKQPNVLVSNQFWYFGENAPELPPELAQTTIALPDRSRRGHRKIESPELVESFASWVEQYPQGIHGGPRDKPRMAGRIEQQAASVQNR